MLRKISSRLYAFIYANWSGFDAWEDTPRITPTAIWQAIDYALPELPADAVELKRDTFNMVKGWPERTEAFLRKTQAAGQLSADHLHSIEKMLQEWQ